MAKHKTSLVFADDVERLTARIGKSLGISKSAVVDLAVRALARKMRIK